MTDLAVSGRGGATVRLFVVHDCEGSYAGSIGWFAQVRSQVSAHIVLRKDGLVVPKSLHKLNPEYLLGAA